MKNKRESIEGKNKATKRYDHILNEKFSILPYQVV